MRNSSLFILLIVALNACSPAYQQDFYEPDYSQFQYEGVPYRTIDEIESKFVYPEQLTDKQISGNVHSAFLVDKFGEVANIEHIDSFSPYASIEVTRVLSSELFYTKRVNSIWKPTLLFSLVTFDYNTSKVNITFSDTSFVQLSRQEQQQILSNLTGGNSYFIEPELIGGLDSIEIDYPDEAKKEKIEGTVIVQLIVGKDGSVNDPKVIEGIGYGCDVEAIRAVQRLRFKPGYNNGKPVNVNYTIPIYFILPN